MIQAIQSNQSFSGLIAPYKVCLGWGRTLKGRQCAFYKKYYHPFLDESLEELSKNLKGLNMYENLQFVAGRKLPISKQDYSNLLAGKSSIHLSYEEKDCLAESRVIPERLYRLWLRA